MAKNKSNENGESSLSSGHVAASVEKLVRPAVEGLGLRLWDVRFEKEGPEWFLRVLVDRDEPMDTDMCEAASRAIDPLLDEADLIGHGYYLEVGSPGLGRKLARDEHFAAVVGQRVELGLFRPDEAGRKTLQGTLLAFNDGVLELEAEDGPAQIERKAVSRAKLLDDEDLFG